jgi:hypothetical protein
MNVKIRMTVMAAVGSALLVPSLARAQAAGSLAPVSRQEVSTPGAQAVRGQLMAGAVTAKTTTGRPYSAEAVTELVQVLADGNRIATHNVSRIYRDGEGRTRREMVNPSGVVEAVSISDPIARTSFTLEPETKTAYSVNGLVTLTTAGAPGARGRGGAVPVEGQRLEEVRERSTESPTLTAVTATPAGGGGRGGMMRTPAPDNPNVHREDLGQQTIEGVPATGTRTMTIIPAGTIGNVQEIRVVSEQWFSPDLQVLVMTRHTDPRSGENTYKLTNIVRAEPDPGLFVVPPDYTVKTRGVRGPQ